MDPVGGASEIAYNIIPVIEEGGGKVKKGKEVTTIQAPLVISDAGVYNTFEKLLPLDVASSSRLWPIVRQSEHGIGAISVFVGINASGEELEIMHKKNAWVFNQNDLDKAFHDYCKLSREEALDVDFPLCFISFPSTKDP